MKHFSDTQDTQRIACQESTAVQPIVQTLIDHLNAHAEFGTTVAHAIRAELPRPLEQHVLLGTAAHPSLTPRNHEDALRRVRWVLTAPQLRLERDALVTWAWSKEREEPKSIILGIKYGELPVGIWGQMKIKEDPMHLLISSDSTLSPTEMATSVTQLSHDVLLQGLAAANGSMRHIEPALGDWFFGSKPLMFFSAPSETLACIAQDAAALNAPYAETRFEHGHLLALTPTLDLRNLERYHELEQIDISQED